MDKLLFNEQHNGTEEIVSETSDFSTKSKGSKKMDNPFY